MSWEALYSAFMRRSRDLFILCLATDCSSGVFRSIGNDFRGSFGGVGFSSTLFSLVPGLYLLFPGIAFLGSFWVSGGKFLVSLFAGQRFVLSWDRSERSMGIDLA